MRLILHISKYINISILEATEEASMRIAHPQQNIERYIQLTKTFNNSLDSIRIKFFSLD